VDASGRREYNRADGNAAAFVGPDMRLYFMDKGFWSSGTLFIASIAHVVGTPKTIAISGLYCAFAASLRLNKDGRAKAVRSKA